MAFDKKEYMKEYYKKNREKINENHRKYYEQNKEKLKETSHNYYVKNKDKMRDSNKEWIKNNKQRFRELCYKSRKKRADNLRQQGVINAWNVVNKGDKPKYKVGK